MPNSSVKPNSRPLRKVTYGLSIAALAGLIGFVLFGLLQEPVPMRISLLFMFVFMSLALLSILAEGITTGRMIGKGCEVIYEKSRIPFILTFAIYLFLLIFVGGITLKILKGLFHMQG